MFEDGAIGPDEIPRAAGIIEAKLAQMELLIEQMLETARLEYGDMPLHIETVDLRAVMEEQIEKVRPLVREHVLRAFGTGQEVLVKGDQSRIATVAANLLDNAIKYSSGGGEICCTVGRRGDEAFLEVSDEGLGIAPEHIDRLFTRFGRLPTEENRRFREPVSGCFSAARSRCATAATSRSRLDPARAAPSS